MEELIKSVLNNDEKVYINKLEEAIKVGERLQVNPIQNTKLLSSYVMAQWDVPLNHNNTIELMDKLEEIILANYVLKTSGGYFFKFKEKNI